MAAHSVHRFDRLISSSDTGRSIFGCSFTSCGETEIRQRNQPSPYAVQRAKRQAAKKKPRGGA